MFKRIMLITVFCLSACTKNDATKNKNFLSYQSPIQFVSEKIEDKDQVAMIKDSPVSWSQLMSQDLALQELQEKYDTSRLVFSYLYAESQLEQSEGDLTIQFAGPVPEKLKDFFKKNNLSENKKITLESNLSLPDDVVAEIGDKKITWDQYISANINHAKLYKDLFTQRLQRLSGIVIRRYLLDAAKQENLPMEDYVQKHIMTGEINPTEDDARNFAKAKGISESDLDEKMIDRLKDIVKQNDRDTKIVNYVAKNLIKDPVKVAFPDAKIIIKTPDFSNEVPQWGSQGPELIFIGHWNCEGCPETINAFLSTKEESERNMRGTFVYAFPEQDREARMGAEAALCVESLNKNSFWTFIKKILEINEEDPEARINAAAEASGVDFTQFKDCFLKRKFQGAVDNHLNYAMGLGITQSPVMVIQGQVLGKPFNPAELKQKLKELKVTGSGFFAKIKSFFGF
jgi:hypothetical protein